MEAYTDFAAVYDTFMDETPYEEWGVFVSELIEKYGISKPYAAGVKSFAEGGESTEMGTTPSDNATLEDTAKALDEQKKATIYWELICPRRCLMLPEERAAKQVLISCILNRI